jgi:hypothetical protein
MNRPTASLGALTRGACVPLAAAVLAIGALAPAAHGARVPRASAAAATARGMSLGFVDGEVAGFPNPSDTGLVLSRAHQAGASIWVVNVRWATVAPTPPPSLADARDPAWPGYNWSGLDAMLRAVAAAGLRPQAVLTTAPPWAEGPGRPSTAVAPAGTWAPSASWLGAFAAALGKRYSGAYTPAGTGAPLPAIRNWEPWNEPNLALFLNPQWQKVGRTYQPASPSLYRGMLNAFYAGIKSVAPSDVVAAGATAPFGDPPGESRMQPLTFWQQLLCVTAAAHPRSTRCGASVSFDAISHHPYPVGPPTFHAANGNDVSVPDLGKITRLIGVAERAGTVRPAGAKPLWITEISWNSKPPDPNGLSLANQALYLEGAINVLYREGASEFVWFNLRDQPFDPPLSLNLQSGLYTRGATPSQDAPKPSLTAYSFPFTAYRSNGFANLWGMAPGPGRVSIQAQRGSAWVTVSTLTPGSTRVFSGSLLIGPRTRLRAVSGTNVSLTWTTT